jgi:hypothetical protein
MIKNKIKKAMKKLKPKRKELYMKKLVQVQEIEGEGLEALMGENVTLFCQIYIYTGKLIGVNSEFVLLENAHVVYETGAFNEKNWKDAQKLPGNWYVTKNSIESFGLLK